MTIRRNARWQQQLDERILECLEEELYSYPGVLETEPQITAKKGTIRDRCKALADAGLIHIDIEKGWRLEIRGEGERYLRGETDVEMFPYPRSVPIIDEQIRNG
jgi:hypothetical protein